MGVLKRSSAPKANPRMIWGLKGKSQSPTSAKSGQLGALLTIYVPSWDADWDFQWQWALIQVIMRTTGPYHGKRHNWWIPLLLSRPGEVEHLSESQTLHWTMAKISRFHRQRLVKSHILDPHSAVLFGPGQQKDLLVGWILTFHGFTTQDWISWLIQFLFRGPHCAIFSWP